MHVQHTTTDQDWNRGNTTYWFRMDGSDAGTGIEFDGAVFGLVEGEDAGIVDADGLPLTEGDYTHTAVARHCTVTDAMRATAAGIA
jgi:hypothetical protein